MIFQTKKFGDSKRKWYIKATFSSNHLLHLYLFKSHYENVVHYMITRSLVRISKHKMKYLQICKVV